MKRYRVETSPAAAGDLDLIYIFIAEGSPQNAEIVQDAYLDVLERLSGVPTLGHIHPEIDDDSIRFVPFKSFEAAYEFTGDTVRVLRVIHSARNYGAVTWR